MAKIILSSVVEGTTKAKVMESTDWRCDGEVWLVRLNSSLIGFDSAA